MRKQTHIYIARLSVENIIISEKLIKIRHISKWAFYFGTVLPDLSITQFRHPHYYEKSSEYVFNKLDKIERKPTKGLVDAIRLGEMAHYLCDFCCYAHNGGSIGRIFEHLLYERKINRYILNNYHTLQDMITNSMPVNKNTGEAIKKIKNELEDYRNMEPSYDRDIMKSINITTIIYFDILLNQSGSSVQCERIVQENSCILPLSTSMSSKVQISHPGFDSKK